VQGLESGVVLLFFGLVQVVGLGSACLARIAEGSSRQTPCQWLFLVSLAAVGVATMALLAADASTWLVSATTLSVMILAVTVDFRRPSVASSQKADFQR